MHNPHRFESQLHTVSCPVAYTPEPFVCIILLIPTDDLERRNGPKIQYTRIIGAALKFIALFNYFFNGSFQGRNVSCETF